MTTNSDKMPSEAIFTSENGRVRAYYRTVVNADDEFNRALIVGEYAAADRGNVPLKTIFEWALTTFCIRLELLEYVHAVGRRLVDWRYTAR